jgi:hypothetical protein
MFRGFVTFYGLSEECSPIHYFPIIQQVLGSIRDGLRPFQDSIFHPAGCFKRIEFADGQVNLASTLWAA